MVLTTLVIYNYCVNLLRSIALLALCLFIESGSAGAVDPVRPQRLASLTRGASPRVLELALQAVSCAQRRGLGAVDALTVIDYTKPSTEPRLWVFDLVRSRLLFEELVAHGKNSGENFARDFSNDIDSKKSSLGLFRTGEPYVGQHGYSLRLEGLEPGINDRAMDRSIVMHGARYVSTATVQALGRLGRSWGCPAVRPEIAQELLDTIKSGRFLFAYYPDSRWMAGSTFLNCKPHTQQ